MALPRGRRRAEPVAGVEAGLRSPFSFPVGHEWALIEDSRQLYAAAHLPQLVRDGIKPAGDYASEKRNDFLN
ncbi:hypothetical protein THAOC_30947 [Thalassiosira oceanica]|uniref:Uncharacterized protein n=1 Tax=Thalassiosira oceanica TaxID=159749 RepID=K0RAB3_THAOC|nr:hypothetical protein THAOC_30947 [Thalassiosira oceanica]|eukprot:EJK50115.1 hypothetical protein THAOC_30947 [Thalassiosira oceanica]